MYLIEFTDATTQVAIEIAKQADCRPEEISFNSTYMGPNNAHLKVVAVVPGKPGKGVDWWVGVFTPHNEITGIAVIEVVKMPRGWRG